MKFIFVEPHVSVHNLINLLATQHSVLVLTDSKYEANGVDIYPTAWYFNQRNYDCDVITFFNKPEVYITILEKNIRCKISVYWHGNGPHLHTLKFPKSCLYITDVFVFLDMNEQVTFSNMLNISKGKTMFITDTTLNDYVSESERLIALKQRSRNEYEQLRQAPETLELISKYQAIVPFFSNKIEVANFFLKQGNILFNTPHYEPAEHMFMRSWESYQSDSCAQNLFMLYEKHQDCEKMFYWFKVISKKEIQFKYIKKLVSSYKKLSVISRIGLLYYVRIFFESSNDVDISHTFIQSIIRMCFQLRCIMHQDESTALLRSAVIKLIEPKFPGLYKRSLLQQIVSTLMFSSNYHVKDDKYMEDCRKYEKYIDQLQIHRQIFKENTRIRIGFLSGDFGNHPVSYILNGFIEYIDKSKFELYLLSDFDVTSTQVSHRHLKKSVDHIVCIANKTASESIPMIQECNLDIIVDMCGHTSNSTEKIMDIVRCKPAKVICNYFAYPGTTAIQAVDFKLGDDITLPASSKHLFTEEFQSIVGGFHCYKSQEERTITKSKSDIVRFGVYNNPQKYTKQWIDTICKILVGVPNSQIHFCYGDFRDESICMFYNTELESRGVVKSRIFYHYAGVFSEYVQQFVDIDIALDTFPYNGGTVNIECLYFSTPYISLLGDDYVARVGASILTQVGHPELIAYSVDEYVQKSIALASNKSELEKYHKTIRDDMNKSTLGNGKLFAHHFQNAMCDMLEKKGVRVGSQQPVPKLVHQIWHSKDMPPGMTSVVHHNKAQNPDYQFILYDDEDCKKFIETYFDSSVLQAYNTLVPRAYKSDLARYCILYRLGGIYLDTKFKCMEGFTFSEIATPRYVKDIERWGDYSTWNGLIVSQPMNNTMLKSIYAIVENCKTRYYGRNALSPTGPLLLADCAKDEHNKVIDLKYVILKFNESYIQMGDRRLLSMYESYREDQKLTNHPWYDTLYRNKEIYLQ